MFLLCHILQVLCGIFNADAVEIIDLATAQDSRQYLMLFGSGKDENGMMRRLFQGLQKSIEGSLGQHVYLVNDIYFIFADLRRDTYLLYQRTDVFYGVIAGGIQLMNVI